MMITGEKNINTMSTPAVLFDIWLLGSCWFIIKKYACRTPTKENYMHYLNLLTCIRLSLCNDIESLIVYRNRTCKLSCTYSYHIHKSVSIVHYQLPNTPCKEYCEPIRARSWNKSLEETCDIQFHHRSILYFNTPDLQ